MVLPDEIIEGAGGAGRVGGSVNHSCVEVSISFHSNSLSKSHAHSESHSRLLFLASEKSRIEDDYI